jgi:hypothetical protein
MKGVTLPTETVFVMEMSASATPACTSRTRSRTRSRGSCAITCRPATGRATR